MIILTHCLEPVIISPGWACDSAIKTLVHTVMLGMATYSNVVIIRQGSPTEQGWCPFQGVNHTYVFI